jgi:hypothetical protein
MFPLLQSARHGGGAPGPYRGISAKQKLYNVKLYSTVYKRQHSNVHRNGKHICGRRSTEKGG